jgi:hypothetical protein
MITAMTFSGAGMKNFYGETPLENVYKLIA